MTSLLSKPPWQFKLRSSERFILTVISISLFTDIFLYSMIVPIIPKALTEHAGISAEDAQHWVIILLAVYGATLLLGSPIFGYFVDRYRSRKLPFVLSLASLAVSTVFFALSTSPVLLIVARGLQGISGAVVWVVGMSLVIDTVPGDRIGEVMGEVTMASTWGNVFGPMVGGVMSEKLGYYGAFVPPTIFILIDIAMRLAMIEKPAAQAYQQVPKDLDAPQSPLLPDSPATACAETDHESPRATVFYLFRSPRLPVAFITILVIAFVIPAFEATLPLFVIDTFHWSSTGGGLILFSLSIPSFAGIWLGRQVDRYDNSKSAPIGFSIIAVALVCLRFVDQNRLADQVLLAGLLMVIGLVVITLEITASTEVFQIVEDAEKENPGVFGSKPPVAQSYALLNMCFALGAIFGPLVAGSLRAYAGWKMMTLVLGVLCALCIVPVRLYAGRSAACKCDDTPMDHVRSGSSIGLTTVSGNTEARGGYNV